MALKTISYKLLLWLGVITFFSCTGQTNANRFFGADKAKTIGTTVTALDETIFIIYQDKKGDYWFGSNGKGVFRYDGKNIQQLTKEDGLVSNHIRGIQEDKFANIYFDTPLGVSKFNGTQFSTLTPINSSSNDWQLAPDDLWFKGNGDTNGPYRYDGNTLFHLPFPDYNVAEAFGIAVEDTAYSPFGVYSIYKDTKGHIWFGTLSAGVFRYDGQSILWIAEQELTVLADGRVPGVRSIIEDKEGHFWLGNILSRYHIPQQAFSPLAANRMTYDKLIGIEPIEGQERLVFPYYMSAVTDDVTKDLWMVTYDAGVWRYDGVEHRQYPIKDGKTDVLLFSIYKDKQGTLWLGTHNAGVFKFNGHQFERFKP